MIQNTRPTLEDRSHLSSPFYKGKGNIVDRLSEVLLEQDIQEKMEKQAKDHLDKVFKRPNTDEYKGISERDTEITKRIAHQTFEPANDSAYRTQLVIEQRLKNQIAQAKEDLAREKANMAHIKEALNYY